MIHGCVDSYCHVEFLVDNKEFRFDLIEPEVDPCFSFPKPVLEILNLICAELSCHVDMIWDSTGIHGPWTSISGVVPLRDSAPAGP